MYRGPNRDVHVIFTIGFILGAAGTGVWFFDMYTDHPDPSPLPFILVGPIAALVAGVIFSVVIGGVWHIFVDAPLRFVRRRRERFERQVQEEVERQLRRHRDDL